MTRQFDDATPQKRIDSLDRRHDCAYESGGLRCRYAGTIGDGTNGGGACYCRTHSRHRGTLFAQQALEASQSYRPPVVEDDPCLDPDSWLARNFPMRPGELRRDYNRRCKVYALAMLGRLRVKPVVGFVSADAALERTGSARRMREPGEDLVEL